MRNSNARDKLQDVFGEFTLGGIEVSRLIEGFLLPPRPLDGDPHSFVFALRGARIDSDE